MEEVKKMIQSCPEEGMHLTGAQAQQLQTYVEQLEDLSELGEAYKKELAKEVMRLFTKQFPELDRQLLASVTGVMTAKELTGFKKALQTRQHRTAPQLAGSAETAKKTNQFTEFKI